VKAPSPAARAAPLLCLLLGGCTGLFRSDAPPEQTYYLRAPAVPAGSAATAGTPLASSLRVARPLADPGLDTARIMLLQPDHRMSFYAGSRWPATAPELVAAFAVQTLRASGQWASVEDAASPFPSDYLLQMTIRRFDADYTGGAAAPQVHVVFDCIIGRREGRDVVASFVVAGNAPASANRLTEVVGAFEQATGSALEALTQQALQAVRAADAHAAAAPASHNADSPVPSSSRPSQ
jgi:cholesterol transport system auxiliary component